MVYAPSQQDTLTGQIQVFAIADMLWVKPEADTKFQVRQVGIQRGHDAFVMYFFNIMASIVSI